MECNLCYTDAITLEVSNMRKRRTSALWDSNGMDDQFRKEGEEAYRFTTYEPVYDMNMRPIQVPCDECPYSYIVYDNGKYFCPKCRKVFSRAYVYNWIGHEVEQECLICDKNYPMCISCPYGII